MLNFFFQAEDGIRDDLVTGVQTCALPIWDGSVLASTFSDDEGGRRMAEAAQELLAAAEQTGGSGQPLRSEERRVGKECRSRRAREKEKERREEEELNI